MRKWKSLMKREWDKISKPHISKVHLVCSNRRSIVGPHEDGLLYLFSFSFGKASCWHKWHHWLVYSLPSIDTYFYAYKPLRGTCPPKCEGRRGKTAALPLLVIRGTPDMDKMHSVGKLHPSGPNWYLDNLRSLIKNLAIEV